MVFTGILTLLPQPGLTCLSKEQIRWALKGFKRGSPGDGNEAGIQVEHFNETLEVPFK